MDKKIKRFVGAGLGLGIGLGVTSNMASELNVKNPAAQSYSIAGVIPTVMAGGLLIGAVDNLGKKKRR